MINVVLLLLSIVLGTSKNVLSKLCPAGSIYRLNAIAFFVASCVGFLFLIGTGIRITAWILLMALAYALFTFVAQVAYIKAVAIGDFAISSLMYSCGFVLPTLLGAFLFRESVSPWQIVGLTVLILSFVLANLRQKTEKSTGMWLFLSLSAMLSSGMVGLIQKLFRASEDGGELDSLLTVSFLMIAVVSGALVLFQKRKEGVPTEKKDKRLALLGLSGLLGCVIFLQNKTNLFLSGALSSMLFFPLVNGGTVVASALTDRVAFGKRIDARKGVSIVLGILGIVLIVIK